MTNKPAVLFDCRGVADGGPGVVTLPSLLRSGNYAREQAMAAVRQERATTATLWVVGLAILAALLLAVCR